MEQLSVFDIFDVEKKDEITFTPDIQEELIWLMSRSLLDVYNKEGNNHETNENA